MHKLQQASVGEVVLKMLVLPTATTEEMTLPSVFLSEATHMGPGPHWSDYPQLSDSWWPLWAQIPPHHPLGGAWDDNFHGVAMGRCW